MRKQQNITNTGHSRSKEGFYKLKNLRGKKKKRTKKHEASKNRKQNKE